ncbi:15-hydroxyprostaglandin dehydrogenase [Acromyrmex echinatior]|uniref:15-hydroxyprostaglandin dehydrogenase n=1 Tax=Acromyrmex echinatior TaxID=103372 RepID=F4WZ42_ACREC|nr:15-hydroxyprostaglandin dehydrogenase [Acromyrmex echinatior]
MITGAAGGLGYKFVEILLRNGAKSIAMIDLSTSNGQNAATTLENEFGKGRVVFIACDITKADDLEKTFKKIVDTFKGLDIVINNAAIFNDNYWEKTIDLNIKALIHNSMMAFDYMGKHKGGKGGVIVNIASVAALDPGYFFPIYSASKCAVLGFSQSLASMYDKTEVRVIIMCPGLTATPLTININSRVYDSIRSIVINKIAGMENLPKQTSDNLKDEAIGAKSVTVIDLSTSNGQNALATLENEFGKGRAIFITSQQMRMD